MVWLAGPQHHVPIHSVLPVIFSFKSKPNSKVSPRVGAHSSAIATGAYQWGWTGTFEHPARHENPLLWL